MLEAADYKESNEEEYRRMMADEEVMMIVIYLQLVTYLIFVTDTTDGVCVKKIARCKFLQI